MRTPTPGRLAADLAFSRAAGAPLVGGNAVRLLADGAENYPAWLAAIAAAERFIHFESYIIHDDATGARFAAALSERARAGVRVRIIYDWFGAAGATPRAFWYPLVDAGVEVRVVNPPSPWRPFGWLSRDHRKMLAVDGRVAYVSGLCVGDAWIGTATVAPWRDTGVEIQGPAVADIHEQYDEIWSTLGPPLPADERPERDTLPRRGDVSLRIIGSQPADAAMMRLDTAVAGLARERLWITDAYFVGVPGHVQALTAAAADGVDVRLLVPGESDLPWVRSFSRAGYRGLLDGGVRVFEWNGPMLHAKSAVADGRWARVGSSDLNLQSWIANWELDVAVEDETFGAALERMFAADLANATEVVLHARGGHRRSSRRDDASGRAAASALRLGNTVGAALTARRPLGAAEAPTLAVGGGLLVLLGALAAWRPALLAYPLAAVAAWVGVTLLWSAWRTARPQRGQNTPG